MEQATKEHLREFLKICYSRLEYGERKRGTRFRELDVFEEIIQELADISNYAFLEYVKVLELRDRVNVLVKARPEGLQSVGRSTKRAQKNE